MPQSTVSTKAEVRFHVKTADWIPEDVRENIVEKVGFEMGLLSQENTRIVDAILTLIVKTVLLCNTDLKKNMWIDCFLKKLNIHKKLYTVLFPFILSTLS